jgi:hypothetical protein
VQRSLEKQQANIESLMPSAYLRSTLEGLSPKNLVFLKTASLVKTSALSLPSKKSDGFPC